MKILKKYCIFFLVLFYTTSLCLFSQVQFDRFFTDQSLRIDLIQAGNTDTSIYYFSQLKQEPYWSGSHYNLIDTFRYGSNMVMVYDSASDELLYSRGYATLFNEWQTTNEAKTMQRSFYETVIIPYPKQTIKIQICSRNKKNNFIPVFEMYTNPNDYFITKEAYTKYQTSEVIHSGSPSTKVDIVFLPDGYTQTEMQKFRDDVKRFTSIFFSCSPFNTYKDHFNMWLVEAPSEESGIDIPVKNIWKNNMLNTTFYTFNSERYITTMDIPTVRDLAGHVPYDQIYILVNSTKYGGGGIYNFYSACASDHPESGFVFCHEFAHSFAALADEYYTSSTSYNTFYDLSVEPYQPNITTLVHFESKWKDMLEEGIPIPTPSTKEYIDKIGVFEGGGYVAKGIYRPTYDSSMKSIIINNFGPVNERAIIQMILFYSK